MFGIYRFVLSLLVVAAHLGGAYAINGILVFDGLGNFAVFGFYVVSGYLMTLVLNQTYQFAAGRFWLNRFLRLYPAYYFACAVSLAAYFLWPNQAVAFHAAFQPTSRAIDWLGVVTIFPFPFYDPVFRPIPPTWSVGVEIVMYFLLFAVIARRDVIAKISAVLALGYVILANRPGSHWDTYSSLWAAWLPFSLGAVIYFARDRLVVARGKLTVAIAAIVVVGCVNIFLRSRGVSFLPGFYFNLVLCAGLIAMLAQVKSESVRFRNVDRFLGDLAYPVFLVHWPIGFLVSVVRGSGTSRDLGLLLWSLPCVLALSVAMVFFIDRPIARLRKKVRPGSTPLSEENAGTTTRSDRQTASL